jgi:putative phage-type endonuclease
VLVVDVEQGSQAWIDMRLGIQSASRFHDIITPSGTYSASSRRYIYQLMEEIKTGEPATGFFSKWMERGIDMEDEAAETYSMLTMNEVEVVGIIFQDDKREVLCSPDRLTEERRRGLEIKCPKLSTFYEWKEEGRLPAEHKAQVQGSMMVSGLYDWDFFAYHPEETPILIHVERDDFYIDKLRTHMIQFQMEKKQCITNLMTVGE